MVGLELSQCYVDMCVIPIRTDNGLLKDEEYTIVGVHYEEGDISVKDKDGRITYHFPDVFTCLHLKEKDIERMIQKCKDFLSLLDLTKNYLNKYPREKINLLNLNKFKILSELGLEINKENIDKLKNTAFSGKP